MTVTRTRSTLSLAAMLVVLASLAAPTASAQSGLGSNLDDPTGREPARPRARPEQTQTPPARSGEQAPAGYEDADIPPAPGASYGVTTSDGDDSRLADRMRALDASWAVLGSQGLNYTSAVLSLVLGAAQVVIGGVLLEVGGGFDLFAPVFITMGSIQVARAIVVDFILRPNPQPTAIRYASMPGGTRAQRLARLRYGEEQLESLAEQSAIIRYVDSGITLAGAAVLVGAYFAIREDSIGGDFQPYELLFFIGPAVSVVVSLINLFTPSNAERRWDAYRQMRERTGGDLAVELTPTIGIDPNGGAFAGVTGRF